MELIDEKVSSILGSIARGEIDSTHGYSAMKGIGDDIASGKSVCDLMWLSSFTESDAERCRMQDFLGLLFKEGFVGLFDILQKLEPDSIPSEIYSSEIIKRKRTQAKTKRVYNVPVFNLLSECAEGYAALTESIWSFSMHPISNCSLQAQSSYVKELIGKYALCPNRSLGVILAVLTRVIDDEARSAITAIIVSIFSPSRIESILRFHLLSFGKTGDNPVVGPSDLNPSKTTASSASPVIGKTPQSLIRSIVTLHQHQAVSLHQVWAFLSPLDDSVISCSVSTIQDEYKTVQESVTRILSGSLTSSEEDSSLSPESKLSQTIAAVSVDLGQSQKFLLTSELLKAGLLDDALPFLKELQRQFGDIPLGSIDCIAIPLLSIITDSLLTENLSPRILHACKFLGVYIGRDVSLISSIFETIRENSLWDNPKIVSLMASVLFPAISVSSPNPHLTHTAWECLSNLSATDRFTIYALWTRAYDDVFPLKLTRQQVINQSRTLLKRVVKGAQVGDIVSRNSHYQFAKIAATNPIPSLRYMLSNIQVHFNYNLIEPYIEVTSKIPGIAQDIVQFLSCLLMTGSDKAPLNTSTATVEPWLSHLSEFMGRFYRKHPTCPLDGLMSMITVSLTGGQADILTSSTPGRVVLEAIIEYMGGFKIVQQLNADQIESISGGPILTSLALAGTTDTKTTTEKAKTALKSALLSHEGVVESVIYSLTNQLNQLMSNQSVARQFMTGGGVKLLGILFDGISRCLYQLCDFVSENCSLEEYRLLIKSSNSVLFGRMDQGIAHHVVRPMTSISDMSGLADFFWRLKLSDIHVPEDHYRKHLVVLKEKIGWQEALVDKAGDQKDSLRSAKRELLRLKETAQNLEDEMKIFVEKNALVLSCLKSLENVHANDLVENYVSCRVFMSIEDAIFCAKFVKLLYENKTEGFNLIEFFDSWTQLLSQSVSCCSEGEIKIFSEFVNEMMVFVLKLRDKASSSSSAWSSSKQAQHISPVELKDAHHRWEGNITRGLRDALENGEWCEKRNCLILISRTCESFPMIEANALELKSVVERLATDPAEDIATLALSLSRKIASLEGKWIDKTTSKETVKNSDTVAAAPQLEIEPMNVDEDGGSKRPDNKDAKVVLKQSKDIKEEVVKRPLQLNEKKTDRLPEPARAGAKRATPSVIDEAASKRSRPTDDRQDRDINRDRGRPLRNTESDTIPRNRDARGNNSRR